MVEIYNILRPPALFRIGLNEPKCTQPEKAIDRHGDLDHEGFTPVLGRCALDLRVKLDMRAGLDDFAVSCYRRSGYSLTYGDIGRFHTRSDERTTKL
jgi:hypothetical protein